MDTHFRVTPGPLAHSTRDCIEVFKILSNYEDIHYVDPFQPSLPFKEGKFKEMLDDKSKIKVGILSETPFLPVSKSVKRAIEMTKKALVEEGYEVVDFKVTPEEFAQGRNFTLEMITGATAGLLCKDFERIGERL